MKTIIAGSRTLLNPEFVAWAVEDSRFTITEVICGMAEGPDLNGKAWAEARGIPVRQMPARWQRGLRSAGFIRNKAMAREAEALVAVWDGRSRGTANMIKEARARGLKVYVMEVLG